jgi:hypothetical protein
MRARADWPKHFTVSAALTVLSLERASDAVGVLKEELDADGGSGFSFGDLLADRAGTAFADLAIRDEEAARALQARLARGFALDDYSPRPTDCPRTSRTAICRRSTAASEARSTTGSSRRSSEGSRPFPPTNPSGSSRSRGRGNGP